MEFLVSGLVDAHCFVWWF